MNRAQSVRILWLAGPYVPIWVGLHVLRNGWATVFGFHAVILAALWIHRKAWRLRTLGTGGGWTWIPLLAVPVAAFGYGLTRLAGSFPGYGAHLRGLLAGLGLSGPDLGFLAAYICLVNPVLEEAFWRGLFFDRRRRPVPADLAYGGIHVLIFLPFMYAHYAWIAAAFLTGMGYLWRRIARHRNGLALPLAWHALGDAALITAVTVILSRG